MISIVGRLLAAGAGHPAVIKRLASFFKLGKDVNVLSAMQARLATYPATATTIATIIAEVAPDVVSKIIDDADDEQASLLMKIVGGVSSLKMVSLDEHSGDGEAESVYGIDSSEILENARVIKTNNAILERAGDILGIPATQAHELAMLFVQMEPESGGIYKLTNS